jgi:low affinity Fe/Cu permease
MLRVLEERIRQTTDFSHDVISIEHHFRQVLKVPVIVPEPAALRSESAQFGPRTPAMPRGN